MGPAHRSLRLSSYVGCYRESEIQRCSTCPMPAPLQMGKSGQNGYHIAALKAYPAKPLPKRLKLMWSPSAINTTTTWSSKRWTPGSPLWSRMLILTQPWGPTEQDVEPDHSEPEFNACLRLRLKRLETFVCMALDQHKRLPLILLYLHCQALTNTKDFKAARAWDTLFTIDYTQSCV